MMTTRTRSTKPDVGPITDHPDYIAASNRLTDLQIEHADIEKQIANAKPQRGGESIAASARAVLAGGEVDEGEFIDLPKLRRKRLVLQEAIGLARQELRQTENRISIDANPQIREVLKPLYQRVAKAAAEFRAAVAAAESQREQFDLNGYCAMSHLAIPTLPHVRQFAADESDRYEQIILEVERDWK